MIVTLESANAEFYRAFESGDLVRMERVWAHEPHVRCVHPGWQALEGWASVRESWRRILATDHDLSFELARVQIREGDRIGWVSCVERIARPAGDEVLVDEVLATNIFERGPGGHWLMVAHHASPVLRAAPPQRHSIN